MISTPAFRMSDEVRAALEAGKPVLALESTIFTHGLPRPRNLVVALEADEQLRAAGVAPATIGVLDGVPTLGLTEAEITRLATEEVVKLSLRDLAVARAKKLSGGTTVAAVAYLANLAGISVMSTGGIGGVHRGAAESFDESADLTVLSQTPIGIVSAGVKSILDIPATLERLETLNIAVLGYGTDHYPGFYIANSGHPVENRVDSPEEVAEILAARDALGIRSAVQIANPVAADRQLAPDVHDRVLEAALAEAAQRGIRGHDATPFLLDYIQNATDGASLEVNLEVYRSNVALGARIAHAVVR